MRILRVLGLVLAIILVRFVLPEIFHAMEDTLLLFFDTLQFFLLAGQETVSATSYLLPR
jgi:hypothetical protein